MANNTINENDNDDVNIKRELNLKRLERIAEDNVNLTTMLQHDLKTTALFSIISLLIGIIIIALKQYFNNTNSPALKITAASISGSIGGGVLFLSIRNILDNWYNKTSSSIGNDIIGSSEHTIKEKFTTLSRKNYENDMEEIIKTIKRRNERLQSVRSTRSILMIISSLVLICLVLCSIFFGLYKTKNVNSVTVSYVADGFLIAGGVTGLMQCIMMYFVLSNPNVFEENKFNFFFFITLHTYGLILKKKKGQDPQNKSNDNIGNQQNQQNQLLNDVNNSTIENGQNQNSNDEDNYTKDQKKLDVLDALKKDINLYKGSDLYILRIVLDNEERENIERIVHGLPCLKLETSKQKSWFGRFFMKACYCKEV
jgi:hypothetical protein